MRTFLIVMGLALAGISSACGEKPHAESAWKALYSSPMTSPVSMGFWVKEDWVGEVEGEEAHPCGATVSREVVRMPAPDAQSPLDFSEANELANGRRVSPAWHLPPDYYPLAIAGNWLLIREYDNHIWVNRDGRLMRAKNIPAAWEEPPGIECPAHRGKESEYCVPLKDLETGRRRLIARESICS